jgi:hypothetical protein
MAADAVWCVLERGGARGGDCGAFDLTVAVEADDSNNEDADVKVLLLSLLDL